VTCVGTSGGEEDLMVFDLQIRNLRHNSGRDWSWRRPHDILLSKVFRYSRASSGSIINVYLDVSESVEMGMLYFVDCQRILNVELWNLFRPSTSLKIKAPRYYDELRPVRWDRNIYPSPPFAILPQERLQLVY
jgi:hypothetical protein